MNETIQRLKKDGWNVEYTLTSHNAECRAHRYLGPGVQMTIEAETVHLNQEADSVIDEVAKVCDRIATVGNG